MTETWNDRLFMTRGQIREYDRIAVDEVGMPGAVLMENAGAGAARIAARMAGARGCVAVMAGPGNNGGDGFVIARHLLNAGFDVRTFLAVPGDGIAGDAALNLALLRSMGAPIVEAGDPASPDGLADALRSSALVVDALLGTGVSRDVEGRIGELIDAINGAGAKVLAVDIPSGLDADSGSPWGKAVRADETATFGHIKRGLLLYPGAALAGPLTVVPIGAPAFVSGRAGWDGILLDETRVRPLLPRRSPDSHKGTYGHLLVLAGSLGKTGAATMTSRAAMRAGAGLVTIATCANAQPIIEANCTEVMVEAVLDRQDAPLTEKTLRRAEALVEGKAAVALGPGLSTAPGISALALKILQTLEVPAVVDADGLNILASDPTAAGRISAPMVFTPHPGEMARLINRSAPAVQADRVGVAREAAKWHKVVVVLKGAHTVIAAPDGRVFINPTGNPGMASGGMGDVLTGVIGGLLSQGLEPLEAALLGTYLHGHAADDAASRTGMPSLLASDVIDALPGILKEWSGPGLR
jgi:NAD(P)H-hydrate epimerase